MISRSIEEYLDTHLHPELDAVLLSDWVALQHTWMMSRITRPLSSHNNGNTRSAQVCELFGAAATRYPCTDIQKNSRIWIGRCICLKMNDEFTRGVDRRLRMKAASLSSVSSESGLDFR